MMDRYFPWALFALAMVNGLAGGTYALTLGLSAALFATMATAFNLVYGYTGLLCMGQVAFLGIGAYGSAILGKDHGWSFWLSAPTGGVAAMLFGLLLGYASMRLSRRSFGIATLAASLICVIVARDWVGLTRGSMGMPGLPAPQLGGIVFDRPQSFYWLALGFSTAAVLLMRSVLVSRIGRAFLAVRDNEELARAQGIRTLRIKLASLGLSAFLTGMTGAVLVAHLTIVDPSIFDFYYTETLMIMVVVGGMGSFWPVVASALVFSAIPDLLRFSTDLRMVLYGLVLIAAVLAMPRGIAGLAQRRKVDAWRCRIRAEREAAERAHATEEKTV